MPNQQDNPWEDVVVSILAVNQYSLERTYAAVPGLRQEKVFSPENLSRWPIEEIADRLRRGGCDRGAFMTNLFAKRLSSLGKWVQSKGFVECEKILTCGERPAISALLSPVNGVGPKVLANLFLLRPAQARE
jgi:hypothetical protein